MEERRGSDLKDLFILIVSAGGIYYAGCETAEGLLGALRILEPLWFGQ